jgi:hypothetical protein
MKRSRFSEMQAASVLRLPGWAALCAPVLVGTAIMGVGGAGSERVAVHLAAGIVGLAAFGLVAVGRGPAWSRVAPLLAAAGLFSVAATFLPPGLDGVHRWVSVAGFRLHPSAIVAPATLVWVMTRTAHGRVPTWLYVVALQIGHILQPDAGQATALSVGVAAAALVGNASARSMGCAAVWLLSGLAAWFRPDSLQPVPFVEDIVSRAFVTGPAVGVAALASLALFAASPWLGKTAGSEPAHMLRARAALTGYFAGALVAAAAGAFPVPMLGFGVSPVIGAFLGLAVLVRDADQPRRLAASSTISGETRLAAPTCPAGRG